MWRATAPNAQATSSAERAEQQRTADPVDAARPRPSWRGAQHGPTPSSAIARTAPSRTPQITVMTGAYADSDPSARSAGPRRPPIAAPDDEPGKGSALRIRPRSKPTAASATTKTAMTMSMIVIVAGGRAAG